MAQKSIISIIIPVHNEAPNLLWHFGIIRNYLVDKDFEAELIYIDDGSTDDSLSIIQELARKDLRIHFISFSRNFGKEAATSAGLKKASGDAVIMIDADGQHPVETINEFVEKWRQGFEVVVGVRQTNIDEGVVKRIGSKLFYKLLGSLNNSDTIPGSTDFRLLDRRVIDEFNKLTEHNRITRGLIDWLGFKRAYVDFGSPARHGGKATYGYRKLVRLAIHAFVSNSTKPLQFTGIIGALVMALSGITGIFLVLEKYIFGDPLKLSVTGTAILALFVSLLIGFVLICQWLLAIYIESIHNETQNRPLYVIDKEV